METLFLEFIQVALGTRNVLSRKPSDEEWLVLFEQCERHAISGFVFPALDKLSEQGQKPPSDLLYEWIGLAEQLKGQNALMDSEAARLTKMFENEGHRTAILKGQANALLYPNPLRRQPGDIDIWVSGGKEMVENTLRKLGLLEGVLSKYHSDQATQSYHHIHLPRNENGIDVEVHFRPSSGNHDPFTNRRLQAFLENEIDRDNELTEAGFRIPSLKFALIMQLAHVQRHFMSSGIGMRQVMDYYYLLKSNTNRTNDTNGIGHTDSTGSTDNIRNTDSTDITDNIRNTDSTNVTEKVLEHLGLEKMAGAMMWVLGEVMMLDERLMICKPDARRGEWLLQDMMAGGNFGHYANASDGLWRRFFKARLRQLKMIRFNFWEGIWAEIFFWKDFVKRIPLRMKYRTWSLNQYHLSPTHPPLSCP